MNGATPEIKRKGTLKISALKRSRENKDVVNYVERTFGHAKYYEMIFDDEYKFIAMTNNPAESMFSLVKKRTSGFTNLSREQIIKILNLVWES